LCPARETVHRKKSDAAIISRSHERSTRRRATLSSCPDTREVFPATKKGTKKEIDSNVALTSTRGEESEAAVSSGAIGSRRKRRPGSEDGPRKTERPAAGLC